MKNTTDPKPTFQEIDHLKAATINGGYVRLPVRQYWRQSFREIIRRWRGYPPTIYS